MTKSKVCIIKFFIFLIIFSCTEFAYTGDDCYYDLGNTKNYLRATKTLSIPIDKTINFMSTQSLVRGDSLIRANYFNTSIDIFSIKNGSRLTTFNFINDEPNKIIKFGGAGIVSLNADSFLIGSLLGNVFVTKKDSIISKHNLTDMDLYKDREYRLYGINRTKPIKINNDVYFYRVPEFVQQDDRFYDEKILVKYNIEKKTIGELEVYYPKEYRSGLWSFAHIRPSFTLNNEDKIIYSFPISSNIYEYNIALDSMIKINKCLKSKFDNLPVRSMKSRSIGFYEENKFIKGQIRYLNITYDKYKDVYYRLLALPVENDEDKISKDKDYLVSPLVLMVLDNEFNVLIEKSLKGKYFNYKDYFVNSEGFWLSNNNPKNPGFNEDLLSFTLFNFEDK